MADTSRDVRILAVERLVAKLAALVRQRGFGSPKQTARAEPLLDELGGQVAALRYSYLEESELAAFAATRALGALAQEVANLLRAHPGSTEPRLAFLDFFVAIVSELPAALRRPRTVESLTPVTVGAVVTADKAPRAKNLLLCRVTAFDRSLPIVTNLLKTRAGDRMKVARVPPTEIMGLLSEAQFVGRADAGAALGERPELSATEAQEIRRAMGALLDE